MSLVELNEETIEWLGEWMSQTGNDRFEMTERLSSIEYSCLTNYMNMYGDLEVYELYRGVDYTINETIVKFETLSSWSLNPSFAQNFGPYIMHIKVSSNDVLIDTSLFIPSEVRDILGGFPNEQEVILLPGNYKIQVF